MNKLPISDRDRDELPVAAVTATLQALKRQPLDEGLDQLLTLSANKKWLAMLGHLANYAWQRLPKHRWLTEEQARDLLEWTEDPEGLIDLIAPAFFQLTKRRKGRRAKRLPEYWMSPRDHWGPPWSNLYVLLLPSDPGGEEIRLAEERYKR